LVRLRVVHAAAGRAVGVAFEPLAVAGLGVVEEHRLLERGLRVLRLELRDAHPEMPGEGLALARRHDDDAPASRAARAAALAREPQAVAVPGAHETMLLVSGAAVGGCGSAAARGADAASSASAPAA
jgi:hypothetical protein